MDQELPSAVSVSNALQSLVPLIGRTPDGDNGTDWASMLGEMGNAGIFLVDYAGSSEWERHSSGDEIVFVLDGQTTLFMLIDGEDVPFLLAAMEFVVVPQGIWHRFETPERTQIMTVTPQPTDHSIERPSD